MELSGAPSARPVEREARNELERPVRDQVAELRLFKGMPLGPKEARRCDSGEPACSN